MNSENLYIIDLSKGNDLAGYCCNNKSIQWLDIPYIKYQLRNKYKNISIKNLNSLTSLFEIQVCTKYVDVYTDCDSDCYDPNSEIIYSKYYELLPSWDKDISKMKNYKELPVKARKFICFLEKLIDKKFENIYLKENKESLLIR